MTSETKKLNFKVFKQTILIYMILSVIIIFITKLNLVTFSLFTVGTCASLLNFFLLSISIENSLNVAKKKAIKRGLIWSLVRIMIIFEIIAFVIKSRKSDINHLNLYILVLGFLIVQLGLIISAFKNNFK